MAKRNRQYPEGTDHLDEKGRCCGRKPLLYKREGKFFCTRCDRDFDIETGKQKANWAWDEKVGGGFEKRTRPIGSTGERLVRTWRGEDGKIVREGEK